jgi:hypothetical protein
MSRTTSTLIFFGLPSDLEPYNFTTTSSPLHQVG